MKILVTGAAGFIGSFTSHKLLSEGHQVVGLDNVNDYYEVSLKHDRLRELGIDPTQLPSTQNDSDGNGAAQRTPATGPSLLEAMQSSRYEGFRFVKADLADKQAVLGLFEREGFDVVINLAAQAGVRYSLEDPYTYIDSNITGFLNILEGCRHYPVSHLLYASSSSVYGANTKMPFSVKHNVDHPVSLYAASKKSNELMAHTYSHLFGIPTTGLRFFTVYGPWGRPDMAYFKFAKRMLAGVPIDVYNFGEMERDFTYVDDIVESLARLVPKPPSGNAAWSGEAPDPATSFGPYQLFNIGNNNPVRLLDFIHEIEKQLGVTAEKNFMEIQPGDVPKTWADVTDLFDWIGYSPQVSMSDGIARFVAWYRAYYKV